MTEDIDIRKYELMVIFSGDMPEADFEKQLGEFKNVFKESAKSITHEDTWGVRNLAYRIKKQSRGYYVVFNFSADPSAILELRANLRINQAILRHMLVIVPDSYEPGHHEDAVIFRDEKKTEKRATSRSRGEEPRVTKEIPQGPAPEASEAEQLKTVERKLEKILENPDIDIK